MQPLYCWIRVRVVGDRSCIRRNIERAEMEFIANRIRRRGLRKQRESSIGILLPDLEIAGGDRQPAERVYVASGFSDPADAFPGDLVDSHSVPDRKRAMTTKAAHKARSRQICPSNWGQDVAAAAVASRKPLVESEDRLRPLRSGAGSTGPSGGRGHRGSASRRT